MFVDDRLVEDLPEMLGGLKFGSIGWQEEKADSVRNLQIAQPTPSGVVEHENDDAVATGAGLFGESCEQFLEERF